MKTNVLRQHNAHVRCLSNSNNVARILDIWNLFTKTWCTRWTVTESQLNLGEYFHFSIYVQSNYWISKLQIYGFVQDFGNSIANTGVTTGLHKTINI